MLFQIYVISDKPAKRIFLANKKVNNKPNVTGMHIYSALLLDIHCILFDKRREQSVKYVEIYLQTFFQAPNIT